MRGRDAENVPDTEQLRASASLHGGPPCEVKCCLLTQRQPCGWPARRAKARAGFQPLLGTCVHFTSYLAALGVCVFFCGGGGIHISLWEFNENRDPFP